jgi:hypothetical protein
MLHHELNEDEGMVKHFVAAQIKQFPAHQRQTALDWVMRGGEANA